MITSNRGNFWDGEELFYCKSLNGMSTDYGEINKDLDFSNISAPLVVILKDVL